MIKARQKPKKQVSPSRAASSSRGRSVLKGTQASRATSVSSGSTSLRELLQMAQIRAEKCELAEARKAYTQVLEIAKREAALRTLMEALAGLLRLASEALNEDEILHLEKELDSMMTAHPKQVPPMAWFCKGVIARHRGDVKLAQRHIHRYLRGVRHEADTFNAGSFIKSEMGVPFLSQEEAIARGWGMMALILWQRNRLSRAQHLAHLLLKRYEGKSLRGVSGTLYLVLGGVSEKKRNYEESLTWFQKAHGAFMAEHSWYYHLYVLYAYARLARKQQNYAQAYWYLDLIEKAAILPDFGRLRQEIAQEKSLLEQAAVDLLIDSRQCVVTTRDGGQVSLGKQYVLLHILEALSGAHRRSEVERERGLSKSEIIEEVWKETYRPEAHDNKLYYNINRLRKLIEPDAHKPQYLLNWKEGYRLAPGLKIQFIGSASGSSPIEMDQNAS